MKYYLFVLLCIFKISVFACDCTTPPISKEGCAQYDVIFYGKVDSLTPCNTKGNALAFFTISNLYKGNAEEHIALEFDCVSSCMMSFSKNEEWIIYATYRGFNKPGVAFCSNSRRKASATETTDPYLGFSTFTFEGELGFLKMNLGEKSFVAHNEINDQQNELGPSNEQPSGMNKLLLLGISLVVMFVIYIVSKKYFKNDK